MSAWNGVWRGSIVRVVVSDWRYGERSPLWDDEADYL